VAGRQRDGGQDDDQRKVSANIGHALSLLEILDVGNGGAKLDVLVNPKTIRSSHIKARVAV
jgi:hypothetical protein